MKEYFKKIFIVFITFFLSFYIEASIVENPLYKEYINLTDKSYLMRAVFLMRRQQVVAVLDGICCEVKYSDYVQCNYNLSYLRKVWKDWHLQNAGTRDCKKTNLKPRRI